MESAEESPLKDQPQEEIKKKTLKEKLKRIKENITIEPVLFFFVVPGSLSRLAIQNLNLDKACRVNLDFGDDICNALIAQKGNLYKNEELAVQRLIASMEVWKNIVNTAIPILLILFIGAWSDRTGKRKICILIPIFGDCIMCLSNIMSVYFFHEIPVEATMFFEAFFPAISGGWVSIFMGAFSYISDISDEESRTFRVGILNLCLTAGSPIGMALSGKLLTKIGYYGVFGLSASLYAFSFFYGLLFIHDIEKKDEKKNDGPKRSGICKLFDFFVSFFDIQHVKDTLKVAFEDGPNKRRLKSSLVFAAIMFCYGPSVGEYTIKYMYTRFRFRWDAEKYSYYNTFNICLHGIGALISISIFSRKLKWDDAVLGIVSNASHIFGTLIIGLSSFGYHMYLATAVEIFNATSYTALRSISSKLVSKREDLGKMISLFNLTEIVTSLMFGPLYSWLYMLTLDYEAGAVFFISTCLSVPAVLIFCWFYIQHNKVKKELKACAEETNNKIEIA